MAADSTVDEMIATLGAFANLDARAAQMIAKRLQPVASELAARGVDPESGTAWKPTASGKRAAPNAGKSVVVKAEGKVVTVTVKGNEGWVHQGRGKTMPARPMIPTMMIPEYAAAVGRGIQDAIDGVSK